MATKAGRRLPVQTREGYTRANIDDWVDRSLRNLDVDAHRSAAAALPAVRGLWGRGVYQILDDLVRAGKIRHYGVSVERIDEALEAIRYPGVETVQIIFNIFRPRPAEVFFPEALRREVGVLARVPLASGLLTGKLTRHVHVRGRRSSTVQSRRRSLRQGRDVLGRALRGRAAAVDDLRPLVPAG